MDGIEGISNIPLEVFLPLFACSVVLAAGLLGVLYANHKIAQGFRDRAARKNAQMQNAQMQPAQIRSASPSAYAQMQPAPSAPMQNDAQRVSAYAPAFPASVQSIKLSTISNADNVLVAGPKGSGKTTVLRTLLHRRMQDADEVALALDPHASPGKWPCTVIGGGLDWTAIDAAMQKMEMQMRGRFQELNAGVRKEGAFQRRNYVGDEFLSIAQELDGKNGKANAGKLLISRLVQGRKVGETIMVAAQNDTVEALGIQGNADLKGCFDYLIYLGSLASTRAKYHGCPLEVIQAATKEERVGVVWHPDRNNWYVLQYDLEAIREGQVVSTVSTPAAQFPTGSHTGSLVLVPTEMPEITGSKAGTSTGTSTGELGTSVGTSDGIDTEAIKALQSAGWSANKIAERMQGRRADRLARIRQALGESTSVEMLNAN